jgi:hypothetical protein
MRWYALPTGLVMLVVISGTACACGGDRLPANAAGPGLGVQGAAGGIGAAPLGVLGGRVALVGDLCLADAAPPAAAPGGGGGTEALVRFATSLGEGIGQVVLKVAGGPAGAVFAPVVHTGAGTALLAQAEKIPSLVARLAAVRPPSIEMPPMLVPEPACSLPAAAPAATEVFASLKVEPVPVTVVTFGVEAGMKPAVEFVPTIPTAVALANRAKVNTQIVNMVRSAKAVYAIVAWQAPSFNLGTLKALAGFGSTPKPLAPVPSPKPRNLALY